ncbi:MAG: cryptochrome/photolyase family protein [Bacteroidales bacterium]|nr:cryptochrome/photolyase family protein [Bacteroidales bacterium]
MINTLMEAALIFPHQLFEENPVIKPGIKIFLIEEFLFFRQYLFHKQKLAFHRASMKHYENFLRSRNRALIYIDSSQPEADIRKFFEKFPLETVHVIDPVDNYLGRRLKSSCHKAGTRLRTYDPPSFITSPNEIKAFFDPGRKQFSQTQFYMQQRKSLGILMEESGKPKGGKWTFDKENRKKYPAGKKPPEIVYPPADHVYSEAVQYVKKNFPGNPGNITETPIYPLNFDSAREWLRQFLENRFSEFGDYEDAIVASQSILHHSVLSPLLNSGLLTPGFVISEILRHADENNIALNNTEGIIRQIIGWREFIRGIYEVKGTEERTKNFWGFHRKIPGSFYTGETGIEPLDLTIKKLIGTAYNHHIERLMLVGNFMLLCEFDPDEVYRWFMELYIDAYDWVMVPNVYGMSQFADGGLMSTKPYISGSNYLMKMSNYRKGEWQQIWDGLFWRFMHSHRDFFLANPRLGMLVRTFDKMSDEKKKTHLDIAENYLSKLR